MTESIDRNRNTNDAPTVTTVTLNSVTATTISAARVRRISLEVCLDAGVSDVNVFIRPYPAIQDNLKRGEVLTRFLMGTATFFRPSWRSMEDTIMTSEYSAITDIGEVDVHVTEG